MKSTAKLLILILALAALFSVLGLSVFAMPAYHSGSGTCPSQTGKLVTLDDIPLRDESDGMYRITKQKATKDIPLVIIVIGFKNISYSSTYDWNSTVFVGENSVERFYTDMSFGQFTFVPAAENSRYGTLGNKNTKDKANDGIIHVTLDVDHENWSMQETNPVFYVSYTRSMLSAFIKAINKADNYIDFSSYDANGDGVISTNELAIGFVVAGYEAAYQSADEWNKYSLWSHSWEIDAKASLLGLTGIKSPVVDGVKVSSYIAIPEQLEKGVQEPICVLAHELGHYIGIPDFYDTVYSTDGDWSDYNVSDLSVMCSGSWGQDPDTGEFMPTSFDAFSRYELGWIKPKYASSGGEFTLTSQNYDNLNEKISTVIIPTQNAHEYYLVENRQFTKWDKSLVNMYGGENDHGGLIFWHLDYGIYDNYYDLNAVNNGDHRPAVMPLFPEISGASVSFIGNFVDVYNPFFDADRWTSKFSRLGTKLNLPIYGGDERDARWESYITVEFLDGNSDSIRINVDVDHHAHTLSYRDSQPGCVTVGYTGCYQCSFCKRFFTDETCEFELTYEEATIPALGHVFEYTRTVAPQVGVKGYDVHTCTRCKYEKKSNYKPFTGWGKKGDNWYLFDKSGNPVNGWYQSSKGKKYYLEADGKAHTGWLKYSGKWYYFDKNGAMKIGWVNDVDKWYYTDKNGVMKSSCWIKDKGKWYYLTSSGAMKRGWLKYKNKWYYLNVDGSMRTSDLTYKGKTYRFKSTGECVNP